MSADNENRKEGFWWVRMRGHGRAGEDGCPWEVAHLYGTLRRTGGNDLRETEECIEWGPYLGKDPLTVSCEKYDKIQEQAERHSIRSTFGILQALGLFKDNMAAALAVLNKLDVSVADMVEASPPARTRMLAKARYRDSAGGSITQASEPGMYKHPDGALSLEITMVADEP